MRDDRDVTPQVRAWLAESLASVSLPDEVVSDALRRVALTPQAVGSGGARVSTGAAGTAPGASTLPVALRMAIGAAGLAAAVAVGFVLRDGLEDPVGLRAGVGASPSGPHVLVVDRADPAAYQTIGQAVEVALDGDTVLVRPGVFEERVVITREIVVAGDGDPGSVVVRAALAATDGGDPAGRPVAFALTGSRATLRDLTVVGPEIATAIQVVGGAPLLERLTIDLDGDQDGALPGSPHENLAVDGGSRATVRESTFDGFVSIGGGSRVAFLDNQVIGGCVYVVGPGADAHLRGNTFRDSRCPTFAIGVKAGARPIVEDNTIDGGNLYGIEVMGEGSGPFIRGNDVRRLPIGIWVQSGGEPLIAGNLIESSGIGLSISWTGSVVRENTFQDNDVGIAVTGTADVELAGNGFRGNGVGFLSEKATERLRITGGSWCDNGRDIQIVSGLAPEIADAAACTPEPTGQAGR